MRSLVVANEPPWPATSGARLRTLTALRGLARLGPVDLVVTREPKRFEPPVQAVPGLTRRALLAPGQRREFRGVQHVRWVLGSRLPRELAGKDFTDARARLVEWAEGAYDLVWLRYAESWLAFAGAVPGRVVVDLDDLEDQKILARIEAADPRSRSARQALWRLRERANVRRWARYNADVAREADVVVVCSELDRARLAHEEAVVVPNAYAAPDVPAGRIEVGSPPVVTLIGHLGYEANVDGAMWLVREVLPRLRRRVPDVEVRLVGHASRRVRELRAPGVTVTGVVDDVRDELRQADVIAVPVRFGSGTRVKILEAFAHRIPVVSTSIGAEGLEAESGRQLLLADAADAFAAACADALTDRSLRHRLVAEATALFDGRFRSDRVEELVERTARAAVGALR